MRPLLLVGLIATAAAPLSAQKRVEIIPTVGLYLPAGNNLDQYGAGCSCYVQATQQSAFIIGVRVSFWATPTLGIEGSVGTAESYVHLNAQGVFSGDTSGTVNAFTGTVVWKFWRPGSSALYLSGGFAYITHSSAAYEGLGGTNNWGGDAGLGLRLGLGPSITFKGEVEDYVYTSQFEDPSSGQKTAAKGQNDLVISVGLAIGL